jgi:hypothetical protein
MHPDMAKILPRDKSASLITIAAVIVVTSLVVYFIVSLLRGGPY